MTRNVLPRGVRKRFSLEESHLLDEFDCADLFGATVPLTPHDVADLGYDLDHLQADLAGSETLRNDSVGRRWRDDVRRRLSAHEQEASRLGLTSTSERLHRMSQLMRFE